MKKTLFISLAVFLISSPATARMPGEINPYKNTGSATHGAFSIGYKQAVLESCKDTPEWKEFYQNHFIYVNEMHKYRKTFSDRISNSHLKAYKLGYAAGEEKPMDCKTAEPLPPQQPSTKFYGIWEGTGKQAGESWTLKITLSDKEFLVDYPSLKCGGKLEVITSYDNKALFREKITYGKSLCVDNGKTILTTTDKSEAKYKWYYPNGKLGATGILNKQTHNK